jgi:formylglycine-generating enzyme required for sulfatase activity
VPEPEGGEVAENVGRVLRGGSYNNPPTVLRSANRNDFGPNAQDTVVGFRVARSMPR